MNLPDPRYELCVNVYAVIIHYIVIARQCDSKTQFRIRYYLLLIIRYYSIGNKKKKNFQNHA